MNTSERKAVLSVERGLHMLTYRWRSEPSAGPSLPPLAEVRVASGTMTLIPAPGSEHGVLAGPGTGLAVRAETAGTIEVTLRATGAGGSLVADLELKSVETPHPALAAARIPSPAALPRGALDFGVTAHVSLRGDLTAARGEWICGPGSPGRIEGLEIRGGDGRPQIEIQVASGGRMSGWTPWFPAGTYAGSRGKASPLIGLRLRLVSDAAPNLALKAEAAFLGAPTVTSIGREIELIGASMLDPLVGLRLDIIDAGALDVPMPAPALVAPAQPNRLRVFRRAVESAEAA